MTLARLLRSAAALALLGTVVFAIPATAQAEPASLADSTIEVQLWPEAEQGTSMLIVGVRLPETVKLPATVRIPLPDGAQVFWSGEIMDESLENDVQRTFSLVDGEGGKAIEFAVENTRTVQYEATYKTIDTAASTVQTTLEWIQSVGSKDTGFSVRLPAGVDNVKIEPVPVGDPATNQAGETLYTLSSQVLEPGATFEVSVSYQHAGAAGTTGGSFPWLTVVVVLLALAVVALVLAWMSQRNKAQADDGDTPTRERTYDDPESESDDDDGPFLDFE